MTPSGTLTTLVNFSANNGSGPNAALVQGSNGNFYGTTVYGGSSNGTVFKMTASGTLTTLVNFNSGGINPSGGLVQGGDGNFYGTTSSGSSSFNAYNLGTVFKMTPSGTLDILRDFNGFNGKNPATTLIRASDGNLYGTTRSGGTYGLDGGGQIYRLRLGPALTTQPPAGVTGNSATLNGTVNPGGYATPVSFQYGTDLALASSSTVSAGTLAASTTDTAVQAVVTCLQPGTTYYYRVFASNAENTVPQYGSILSFTTPAPNILLEAPTGNPVSNGSGTLAYSSVTPGQTKDLNVTVRNTGTASLTNIAASITGTDAGQFTLVSTPPATLAAGAYATFTVSFSPTSYGTKSATLSIASSDPHNNPFTHALSGPFIPSDAWRVTYFNQTTNTDNAADSADPDHDGLVNFLERAFNLNPNQPALPILIAGTGTTGLPLIRRTGQPPVFSLQYLRRKASANSGLTYTPQFSSNLTEIGPAGWATATGIETVESIDSEWERVTVEENANGNVKRFGRVKVSSD